VNSTFSIGQAFLAPQTWEALNRADSFEAYVQSWLALLCSSIAETERGVVVLRGNETAPYTPIAFWPDEGSKTDALMKAAETALQANKGVCQRRDDASSSQLAYPVRDENHLRGVVALEVRKLNAASAPFSMRLLQWGLAGLLLALQRADGHQKTASGETALRSILESVAMVLENQGFQKACMLLVTHLASVLDCRRVAIGFLKSRHYSLQALSHSITFSEKTQLSRALEAAMAEAGEMGRCLVFPPPQENESPLYPAHQQLSGSFGGYTICTVPISDGDSILGALVLEREAVFDEETVTLCETVGTMTGLILALKRENEQGVLKRAVMQLKVVLIKMLGPGYLVWKLNGLLLIGAVAFFSVAEGVFRLSANAYLEGAIQQAIVAPIDGFIKEASFRAGDLVTQENLLFKLDDTELRLEQIRLDNQLEQNQSQYNNALAQHKRAEMRIVDAQRKQTKAQLDLNRSQLARTEGHTPFNGIIVQGDLSQKLGAPVKKGEVLFEVAPLDNYRIILEVDERDITEVQEQQTGNLVLTSLAKQVLPFHIVKITPVSETKEGRNFFRVEANLERIKAPKLLRPGMTGIGKIEVGQRHLIWIWTRSLINWLRVWLWSWWP
jgi:multidrug resistance efflux pump